MIRSPPPSLLVAARAPPLHFHFDLLIEPDDQLRVASTLLCALSVTLALLNTLLCTCRLQRRSVRATFSRSHLYVHALTYGLALPLCEVAISWSDCWFSRRQRIAVPESSLLLWILTHLYALILLSTALCCLRRAHRYYMQLVPNLYALIAFAVLTLSVLNERGSALPVVLLLYMPLLLCGAANMLMVPQHMLVDAVVIGEKEREFID